MNVCMYGWMDGQTDVCMYMCMYVCMDGQMYVYVCMYGQTDVCVCVCTCVKVFEPPDSSPAQVKLLEVIPLCVLVSLHDLMMDQYHGLSNVTSHL